MRNNARHVFGEFYVRRKRYLVAVPGHGGEILQPCQLLFEYLELRLLFGIPLQRRLRRGGVGVRGVRGGTFPLSYVYPREMRATRDLVRRRMFLVRRRSELCDSRMPTSPSNIEAYSRNEDR